MCVFFFYKKKEKNCVCSNFVDWCYQKNVLDIVKLSVILILSWMYSVEKYIYIYTYISTNVVNIVENATNSIEDEVSL